MTTQTTIKLCSAIATALDGILVYGDRIQDIGLPAGLTHSWPIIFIGIVAIDRGLHAFLGDAAPAQAVLPVPTSAQKFGPIETAQSPMGQLPDPQAFRQPLGQPQTPTTTPK